MKTLFFLFFPTLFLLEVPLTSSAEESSPGKNQVYIKIGEAKTKRSLIALPPFQFLGNPATTPNFQQMAAELFEVITNDLTISTYFQFIAQSAFLEDSKKVGLRPYPTDPAGFHFESWRQIGAEFLIRGAFSVAGDSVSFETYTYHVPRGDLVLGKKYRGTRSALRKIGHTFANDLLAALTGKAGPFLSKLVFSSDRGGNHYREIYIMDWDGTSVEKITSHRSIALSPAWSPDGKKVAYTAFVQRAKTKTRNADMFIYELESGRRWLVSYRQGINSGACFLPDNKHLLLTISQSGTPDIYKMTFDGELVGKLTEGPNSAMNVEPAASPDGKKVAFSSDRSGQPMIYIMDVDGKNSKRVTFAGKYNATPSWSADGKRLAFSGWAQDHFDIFTMNADGTDMVRITSAKKTNGKWSNNEDPSFSPDGRLLVYTSDRTGKSQIYLSNLDGSEERRLTNDSHNYYKPKWSQNIE